MTDRKEYTKNYNKEYRKNHPPDEASRAKNYKAVKRYKATDKGKFKSYMGHIRRKFGLSEENYLIMLYQQNGKCLLCGEPIGDDICVDHDHKTGKVRGLLHRLCNLGIGSLNDDVDMLEKAVKYLKRFE